MFDTSKKEMLNPNQGYKKFVMKLKQRYSVSTGAIESIGKVESHDLQANSCWFLQCTVNKTEIGTEQLADTQLVLLGAPRLPFTGHELQHIRNYIENGGSAFILMQEGGESRMDTNINAFLEQIGISVNSDSVIRKHFFKYLHPKEAFVGNGVLNKELVRVAKGEAKQQNQKQGKYAKRYQVNKEDLVERDENGGLKFVYPYGATLNVNRPAVPILSSGPISFPANRPIGAFYKSNRGGKVFVLGSMKFFHDDFFEKEDNQKI